MSRSTVALQRRLGADSRALNARGRGPAARVAGLSRALSLALCAALTMLVLVAALATPPAAHAAPVSFNIVVGANPQVTAVNPVTNRIYVANNLGSDVTVIDGATNLITTSVSVGFYPIALAVNQGIPK